MKLNKSIWPALGILIIVGSACRAAGFAPQIAMAIFGAAVIRDRKLAFILPLLSMLLSDVFIEILFRNGYMSYGGFFRGQTFYDSQFMNYILFAVLTLVGFWARNLNWTRIAAVTIAAPLVFFLLSNLTVWLGGSGLSRPHTFSGLIQCYADGLPFLKTSILYTLLFSAVLFGGYFLIQRYYLRRSQLIAD
jgi:hypothetical protein